MSEVERRVDAVRRERTELENHLIDESVTTASGGYFVDQATVA